MPEVRFYLEADDRLLKFAVIVARYQGQWVFASIRGATPMNAPEATGNPANRLTRPPHA